MGEVWEAERLSGPGARGVALKILSTETPDDVPDNVSALRRLLEEAQINGMLRHPNIVELLDVGNDGGRVYLVMELLDGRTFSQLMRSAAPLPPGMVVAVGLQVLEGLDYAHEARLPGGERMNIIHRDIKPSNLMVTRAGAVKIIDFGISIAGHLDQTTTRSGAIRASLAYASPEQVRSEPLSARTDLFSLGLVLHELLTGQRVYKQRGDAAVLGAILFEAIRPVSALRTDVPAALNEVIAWATCKLPEERPERAREFAEALRASLPAEAIWTPAQLARHLAANDAEEPALHSHTVDLGAVEPAGESVREARSRPRLGLRKARFWVGGAAVLGCGLGLGAWILRPHFADAIPVVPLRVKAMVPSPAPEPASPVPVAPPQVAVHLDATPAPTRRLSPRPRPRPHPPSPGKAVPIRGDGWVTVDSRPAWAWISIDGKEVGATPVYRQRLPAGPHLFEARLESGVTQRQQVQVSPGEDHRVSLKW